MDSLEDTIVIRSGENFDLEKVERYLRDHIEGIGEGTLQVRQYPSGASNLTYLLQIGHQNSTHLTMCKQKQVH